MTAEGFWLVLFRALGMYSWLIRSLCDHQRYQYLEPKKASQAWLFQNIAFEAQVVVRKIFKACRLAFVPMGKIAFKLQVQASS